MKRRTFIEEYRLIHKANGEIVAEMNNRNISHWLWMPIKQLINLSHTEHRVIRGCCVNWINLLAKNFCLVIRQFVSLSWIDSGPRCFLSHTAICFICIRVMKSRDFVFFLFACYSLPLNFFCAFRRIIGRKAIECFRYLHDSLEWW